MKSFGVDRRWPFAQGGGVTILVFTMILGAAFLLWLSWSNFISGVLLLFAAGVWVLILFFFRDPNRAVVGEPGLVVSVGDGEIVEIIREREDQYLKAEVIRVSQFLSITDVHVQRIPLAGRIALVRHQPGRFLQAFRPEASDVNENVAMIIESAYGRILVKQIAGILARRCVNYLEPGLEVASGQRFGLIRFSSRIDLLLPAEADLLVHVGDKAYAGLTPIARLVESRTA
jgi:phosphatidylserine decarboxylase